MKIKTKKQHKVVKLYLNDEHFINSILTINHFVSVLTLAQLQKYYLEQNKG